MSSQKSGCLSAVLRLFGAQRREFIPPSKDNITQVSLPAEEEKLPYLLRDDFFSNAELSFFHILSQSASGQWVICPKVSLSEIFYVSYSDKSQAYNNRINRKHVDFLLCNPSTLKPELGVELDDASHQRPDRVERDVFVEEVFKTAGLPLLRIPVKRTYNTEELRQMIQAVFQRNPTVHTEGILQVSKVALALDKTAPICPKCGVPMVLRTAQRGAAAGQQFYGCPNYPRCKEIISLGKAATA